MPPMISEGKKIFVGKNTNKWLKVSIQFCINAFIYPILFRTGQSYFDILKQPAPISINIIGFS